MRKIFYLVTTVFTIDEMQFYLDEWFYTPKTTIINHLSKKTLNTAT